MPAIEFKNVSKIYRRHGGQRLLREHLSDWFGRNPDKNFYALSNVSFTIQPGERVAIVGKNGAGKSTTLSLIARLSFPEEGRVNVQGKVAALLELGSGFHPDLTGLENIKLNASLLGFSRKRTFNLMDQILEFADIGDFVREPLRTYSTGMVMRLAFSVAVNLDPDILITDEILAVGDTAFQAKCLDRISQLWKSGKTLVSVSHGTVIRELCDRAIWLDHGKLIMDGDASDVFDAYGGQPSAPA